MKQVWLCDFCGHSNEDREEVHEHEDKCSFNPVNKNCWTCKNHDQFGGDLYGPTYYCSVCNPDYEDVIEEDLPCNVWEIEV